MFSSLIKSLIGLTVVAALCLGLALYASDHVDTPAVTNSGLDIADLYAFQSPTNANNLVLAVTANGLLSPANTASASFPANAMFEINIDNTGDNVEDLVIQYIYQNGNVYCYGPVAPTATGLNSKVETSGPLTVAAVTPYGASNVTTGTNSNGITLFAGPRDDPFFFDLAQFKLIAHSQATQFNNPGTDTFAGTNVMATVIELPKTLLGTPPSGKLNMWVEAKKKQ